MVRGVMHDIHIRSQQAEANSPQLYRGAYWTVVFAIILAIAVLFGMMISPRRPDSPDGENRFQIQKFLLTFQHVVGVRASKRARQIGSVEAHQNDTATSLLLSHDSVNRICKEAEDVMFYYKNNKGTPVLRCEEQRNQIFSKLVERNPGVRFQRLFSSPHPRNKKQTEIHATSLVCKIRCPLCGALQKQSSLQNFK